MCSSDLSKNDYKQKKKQCCRNLEARYERYKGILKDLTIMSDKLCDLYCKNAEDMHSKILAEMD